MSELSAKILLFSQSLAVPHFFDKVLHKSAIYSVGCYTLSGGCYDPQSKTNRTSLLRFSTAAMLEDRHPGCSIELFDSICSTFPCRSWILQQFHTQWSMVYAWLDSVLRQRWVVVSQPDRFLASGQPDQCYSGVDHPKFGGHECGATWDQASMQMPFRSCPTVQARPASTL